MKENRFDFILRHVRSIIAQRRQKNLWSVIVDVYNWFTALMLSFRATDVLDIVAVSFIIYNVIKIARETRAEQLLKGIFILLIAFTISQIFNLKMLHALFTSFFQFSMLAVLIVAPSNISAEARSHDTGRSFHPLMMMKKIMSSK